MDPHKIYLIEQSLDELEKTDEMQLAGNLSRFFAKVCNALDLAHDSRDVSDPRDACKSLFYPRNSQRKKKFIAFCLLRLLGRNESAIWNHQDFRTKSFNLFDDQIDRIYSHFDVTQDDQNHEKLAKLLEAEETVLANFRNIKESVVNLDTISSARKRFMSTLKSDLNMGFLEQFVTPPSLINDELINRMFATAQEYQESPAEERVGVFQDVKDVFGPFLDSVGKFPSILTKNCIVAPLKKMVVLNK